jgi:hypothetical protein
MHNRTEDQLLAHKRSVDAHRRAQAVLRRRHAAKSAIALIAGAR